MKSVPVSKPALGKRELFGAARSVARGEISGLAGTDVAKFEEKFADFNGSAYAVACSSGTAALHLSLVALGIGPGDEVLVSDTTNMASFFSVIYTGAKPVPVDIRPSSMTMDPEDLRRKVSTKSKAIMPVHLFGQPCDMGKIAEVAEEFGLLVVEDCAEAHGAEFGTKRVGSIGTLGCFSFFANKILTTGEGGIITTNDRGLADELRSLRSLNFGVGSTRFLHRGIGFNYRMSNMQASIGVQQLKRARWLIESRMEVEQVYKDKFIGRDDVSWQKVVGDSASPVTWMAHIAVPNQEIREGLMRALKNKGVETRPGFIPYSLQDGGWARPNGQTWSNSVSRDLAMRTFYLPTWSGMPASLARKVSDLLLRELDRVGPHGLGHHGSGT